MSDNDLIQKGQDDLIRRGDASKVAEAEMRRYGFGLPGGRGDQMQTAINAIPAVQPTVKPLRYIEPGGETLEQMRDHARQHPLAQSGDMRLVWVNEGDLHMHTIFHVAQQTVSPKQLAAQPDDVAALLDAAEKVINSYWNSTDGVITGIYDLEAALARVKGETK